METSSPMRKLSDWLVEVNGIPIVVFHHIDPFSSVKFSVMTVVGGSTSDERINEKKMKRNGTLFWEQNMTRLMIEFVTKLLKVTITSFDSILAVLASALVVEICTNKISNGLPVYFYVNLSGYCLTIETL